MNKQITLKTDIKKKLLLFTIIPLIILSALLSSKIYFILDESASINHKRILLHINYKLNMFFDEILQDADFFIKHQNNVDKKNFLLFNKELDSITILSRDGIIKDMISKYDTKFFKGFDYSQEKIFKKFIIINHWFHLSF